MNVTWKIVLWLLVLVIALWLLFRRRKMLLLPLPNEAPAILEENVLYYRHLNEAKKQRFRDLMRVFLQDVTITGVGVEVDLKDKVLVAASAIIPVMGFQNWTGYPNLKEVLLYPDRFDHLDYRTEGAERSTLGMVGWGVMHGKVVLSKPALHHGFAYEDKSNVGIHEFVHLIDMMDGYTDGIPTYLIKKPQHLPWLKLMYEEISKITQLKSEINPYGATNEAEFFAVASEYFFESPHLLKHKHPELFKMLEVIFNQDLE